MPKIQRYGNSLAFIYPDGSRALAYPINNNQWLGPDINLDGEPTPEIVADLSAFGRIRTLEFYNNRLIAGFGSGSGADYYTSSDGGVTWSASTYPGASGSNTPRARVVGGIILGEQSGNRNHSDDGGLTFASPTGTVATLTRLAFDGDSWVVREPGNFIERSNDGMTFARVGVTIPNTPGDGYGYVGGSISAWRERVTFPGGGPAVYTMDHCEIVNDTFSVVETFTGPVSMGYYPECSLVNGYLVRTRTGDLGLEIFRSATDHESTGPLDGIATDQLGMMDNLCYAYGKYWYSTPTGMNYRSNLFDDSYEVGFTNTGTLDTVDAVTDYSSRMYIAQYEPSTGNSYVKRV